MPSRQSSSPLVRFLVIQVVRYIAATQSFAMVCFHAGWILLAVATWGHMSDPHSGIDTLTRVFLRAFSWLGGVDAQGHGDGGTLMVAWSRIALAIYLIEAAWRRVHGTSRPNRLTRIAMVSWLAAQLGYIAALWPTGELSDALIVLVLFPILAGLSTVWAVAANRLADVVVARTNGVVRPDAATAERSVGKV